jgi:putative endopeptidase
MKKHFLKLSASIIVSAIVLSCSNDKPGKSGSDKAIDLNNMDLSVNPGDDFYEFAVGGWSKRTSIPADQSSIWIGNETVKKREQELLTYFNDFCSKHNLKVGSIEEKLGYFYCTGIDSVKRENEGLNMLKPVFDKINNVRSYEDVQDLNSYFLTLDIPVFFYFYAATDAKNSQINIANVWQKGTCLPDLSPYFQSDSGSKKILDDYESYISRLFELTNEQSSKAKENAKVVIKIENRFAKAFDFQRDTSNKKSIEKLNELTPDFNWSQMTRKIGYPSISEMNILQEDFIKQMGNILKSFTIEEWKIYFKYNLLHNMAPYLNSGFYSAFFDFNVRKLNGVEQQKDLKGQVYSSMKYLLSSALGQIYVRKFFPEESRIKISEMIANIKSACLERIEKLEWMSTETKAEAIAKLQNMKFQIGHPDVWPDFTGLNFTNNSFVENILIFQQFNFKQNMDKIGKPVDPNEWRISVMEPMAYNTASKNEIGFCAGLLFPPEFYADSDDAVNYGAIGSIIGHEIIHFFDNEGKMYDRNGNLKNWWTADDTREYKKRTQVLVDQFNKMYVLDTIQINGAQTLDENIAELGGLAIAYEAYKKSLVGKPEPEKIDGYTDEQRFFIAYAMKDGVKIRDEALVNWVKTNSHSPDRIKINGALFNLNEFYDAFPMITKKNKLYIEKSERAVIF